MHNPTHTLKTAVESDDIESARTLLGNSKVQNELQDGAQVGDRPLLTLAKSERMIDLLLDTGAMIAPVTKWWASGFGASTVASDIGDHLVRRGAGLTAHAASGLGLSARLREILDAAPNQIHAPGGDGCKPLHFARTVAIAECLVDRGANVNARDYDHDSTPAQWRIKEAPEVSQYLFDHGAVPDVFAAAALGDLALTRRLVQESPESTSYRIGHNNGPFPGIGFQGRGGSIYQWTLGFNLSPHEVALKLGHQEIYDYLFAHTPPPQQLLVACMLADRPTAERIVQEHPGLVNSLGEEDYALVAKSCWETNKNIDAVRLMLDLGFPVDTPETNHGFMPLHNAAWCGDPKLVELLLQRGHPVDAVEPQYQGSAVGWAIHSCIDAKRHPEGDFPRTVKLLLEAGVPFDEKQYPVGNGGIDAVLKEYLGK